MDGTRGMREATPEEHEIKPCTVCMAPNDLAAEFCVDCGAPFGYDSSVFPGMVIRPEGAYWRSLRRRKAAEKERPSTIALVATWLLFFPVILIIAVVEITDLGKGLDSINLILFWAAIGVSRN